MHHFDLAHADSACPDHYNTMRFVKRDDHDARLVTSNGQSALVRSLVR